LFFSPGECCATFIFRRGAAPAMLGERLLDANRSDDRTKISSSAARSASTTGAITV
jgi:hypothetical protein